VVLRGGSIAHSLVTGAGTWAPTKEDKT